MRVTIQHRQEDGIRPNKKRNYVDCTVLFSEEEKAIIRERGLGQHYIVAEPETPPSTRAHRRFGILLQALAPIVLLGGCVAGLGMTFAGNGRGGDSVGGFALFAALAMFFGGIALKRYFRVAQQPEQPITLGRLLINPSFTSYAVDNGHAKALDQELRETLARLKDGLLANRDIKEAETFEL